MAKPVDKIKEVLDEILDSIENEIVAIFHALAGKPVSCFLSGVSITTGKEFLEPRKGKKSFFIDLNTNEDISGHIFICLDLKEACWISAAMNGLAASVADEKVQSGQFDENDIDAISELGNQLAGKLNYVLKPIAKKKLHFIKTRYFLNENLGEEDNKTLFCEESIIITPKFSFSAEGKEIGFIYVIFPVEFASLMVGIPLNEKKDNDNDSAKSRKIILLCQEMDSNEEELYNSAADEVAARIITCKFDPSFAGNQDIHEADLIFVDSFDNPAQGIAICRQLKDIPGKKKKSIILTSKNITKELLMEAVTNGITDVIVKPSSSEIILKKIQAYLR